MKFAWSLVFLLLFPLTASADVIATNGSLRALIGDIRETIRQTAGPGTGTLVLPTSAQMTQWRQAVVAAMVGDLDTADQLLSAIAPSYKVVQFTEDSDGNTYYLFVESDRSDPIVPVVRTGWGTYLFNPLAMRSLFIQVPHPVFDPDTEAEGIEVFLQLGAQHFFMAGTHRCSNTPASSCSGTTTACGTSPDGQPLPFRVSDVSHNLNNMLHQTHVEVMNDLPETVVIQLHSNNQAGCRDMLISNTNNPSTVTDGGNVQTIFYNTDLTGLTGEMCDPNGPPASRCNLCGKDNVQGRFTNGSTNPCTRSATSPFEQFIHIEQKPRFRQDPSRLINALTAAFPIQ